MEFAPSKAETDIWMWHNGNVYEYVGDVYVDDLIIVAHDPQDISYQCSQYEIRVQTQGHQQTNLLTTLGMDFHCNSGSACQGTNNMY
jgi:membrane-bound inhibitor of C-type lysozyme